MSEQIIRNMTKDLDSMEMELRELSRLEQQKEAQVKMYNEMIALENKEIKSLKENIFRRQEEIGQLKERKRFLSESIENAENSNTILQDIELQAKQKLVSEKKRIDQFQVKLEDKLANTQAQVLQQLETIKNPDVSPTESNGGDKEQQHIHTSQNSLLGGHTTESWKKFRKSCVSLAQLYLKGSDLNKSNNLMLREKSEKQKSGFITTPNSGRGVSSTKCSSSVSSLTDFFKESRIVEHSGSAVSSISRCADVESNRGGQTHRPTVLKRHRSRSSLVSLQSGENNSYDTTKQPQEISNKKDVTSCVETEMKKSGDHVAGSTGDRMTDASGDLDQHHDLETHGTLSQNSVASTDIVAPPNTPNAGENSLQLNDRVSVLIEEDFQDLGSAKEMLESSAQSKFGCVAAASSLSDVMTSNATIKERGKTSTSDIETQLINRNYLDQTSSALVEGDNTDTRSQTKANVNPLRRKSSHMMIQDDETDNSNKIRVMDVNTLQNQYVEHAPHLHLTSNPVKVTAQPSKKNPTVDKTVDMEGVVSGYKKSDEDTYVQDNDNLDSSPKQTKTMALRSSFQLGSPEIFSSPQMVNEDDKDDGFSPFLKERQQDVCTKFSIITAGSGDQLPGSHQQHYAGFELQSTNSFENTGLPATSKKADQKMKPHEYVRHEVPVFENRRTLNSTQAVSPRDKRGRSQVDKPEQGRQAGIYMLHGQQHTYLSHQRNQDMAEMQTFMHLPQYQDQHHRDEAGRWMQQARYGPSQISSHPSYTDQRKNQQKVGKATQPREHVPTVDKPEGAAGMKSRQASGIGASNQTSVKKLGTKRSSLALMSLGSPAGDHDVSTQFSDFSGLDGEPIGDQHDVTSEFNFNDEF